MRKLLTLLFFLPFAALAAYAPPLEYGVATTVTFDLYNTDGTLDVDEVDSGTEVTLYCDEAAGATATNDFVDEGTFYSIALTAAEMQCARLVVSVGATDTNNIHIWTIGNASAQVDDDGGWYDAVPWNASWDAEVESEVTDALVADGLDHIVSAPATGTDVANDSLIAQMVADDATADWDTYDNTTDSLEALRNRGDAAWTTGSGTGLTAIASGTAQSATGTTLVLASGETFADDELIGSVVQITGGSTGVGQTQCIADNVGTTDTISFDVAWVTTPTGTITYEIAPSIGKDCPQTSADIVNEWESQSQADPTGFHVNVQEVSGTAQTANDNGADINAILVDTGTTLDGAIATVDGNVDAILVDTGTTLDSAIATVDTNVDAILVDTNELQADWANGGRLDLILDARASQASVDTIDGIVDAMLIDTSTTLDNAIAAVQTVVDLLEDGSILASGTCDSGTTTTCVDATLTQANDYWNGAAIVFTSGTIAGQTSCVYDFVAASDTLTFRARTAAVSTNTYILVESAVCEGVVSP